VRGSDCLLTAISDALADVPMLGRSYPAALQGLSWPGLEGRMQMQRFAAASADLADSAQAAEMRLLLERSLVRLLKEVFASLATHRASCWSRTENFPLWRHQTDKL